MILFCSGAHAQRIRSKVLAPVKALFEAMEKGDSAGLRDVFHPTARMSTVVIQTDGTGQLRTDAQVGTFKKTIAGFGPGVLREPIYRVRVRIFGTYAEVDARYAFFFRGAFRHCGVDSFQLMLTADGWRVIQLTDTRQTLNCKVPARLR